VVVLPTIAHAAVLNLRAVAIDPQEIDSCQHKVTIALRIFLR
jgi:hypothetical protein